MKTLQLVIIGLLCYLIKTMATKAELQSALDNLGDVITAEIKQVADALKEQGIPDEAVAQVNALADRIKGIIADVQPPPPPPVE